MGKVISSELEDRIDQLRAQINKDGRQINHNEYLRSFVSQAPNNPFVWSTAARIASDVFVQQQFLDGLKECVQRGGIWRYLKGIYVTHLVLDKPSLNRELAAELFEKYPIAGRILRYTPPAMFFFSRE